MVQEEHDDLKQILEAITHDLQDDKINIIRRALLEPLALLLRDPEASKLISSPEKSHYCNRYANNLPGLQRAFLETRLPNHLRWLLEHVALPTLPRLSNVERQQLFTPYFVPALESVNGYVLSASLSVLISVMSDKEQHLDVLRLSCDLLHDLLKRHGVRTFYQHVLRNRNVTLAMEYDSLICSLPDRISNIFTTNTSAFFYPENYFSMIGSQIEELIMFWPNSVNGCDDESVRPISCLIGRICRLGHSDDIVQVWAQHWPQLLDQDSYWTVLQKCIVNLSMMEAEKLILSFLNICESRLSNKSGVEVLPDVVLYTSFLLKLVGNLVLEKPATYGYIMRQKLLLVRVLSLNALRVLIHTWSRIALNELASLLSTLLDRWTDITFVKNCTLPQLTYVSQAILLTSSYLSPLSLEPAVLSLLEGLRVYLGATDLTVRQLGMVVAECLTKAANPEACLNFEIKDTLETTLLRSLAQKVDYGNIKASTFTVGRIESSVTDLKPEISSTTSPNRLKAIPRLHQVDSDDEDDDLKPFAMPDESNVSNTKVKSPVYLRDAIAFLKSDEPEKIDVAIKAFKNLVQKATQREMDELAIELATIALNLQDTYDLEGFSENRLDSLVALLVRAPVLVVPYLSTEFYERNYNLSQRMDILASLMTASRVLSNIEVEPEEIATTTKSQKSQTTTAADVVSQRIMQKTRITSRRMSVKQPVSQKNRFSDVAGLFFFSLLGRFDTKGAMLVTGTNMNVLLTRYVTTLSMIAYCSYNCVESRKICRGMFEFAWALRYLPDRSSENAGQLRRAILLSFNVIANVLPPSIMSDEFSGMELQELFDYIVTSISKDSHPENVKIAQGTLLALKGSLSPE
ncbi:hypothetical protein SmJEL517_g03423 [Synchytrium microbalum]|uniref:Telomere length regulation protein conserved domain-containing protein n=1 Tax=Synchytrium microbalum TaxID=1806994 RepID=A0A507C6N1_9FUNG|nr:uncharacterized protein SmJEL517_g03423 [Synchytrium microbalum]TPX33714.1 hypothetical protein SmJEL517_g03423 [Synchytrium microbalum]